MFFITTVIIIIEITAVTYEIIATVVYFKNWGTQLSETIFQITEKVLTESGKYSSTDGKLLRNLVLENAEKMDKELLSVLINNEETKNAYFTEVDGIQIFDKVKFSWIIQNKEFLPDSYTRYKNKIGLTNSRGEFISTSNDVELVFPYKDCILEGGQTKEDQKNNEIFYNETLAPDQVSNLLAPKAFCNAKKYDKDGVHEVTEITDSDNLIIKGNNLLALSSLLEKYRGKVSLIYIDPPYNTGNDSFGYNDKFNHSTWLSFLKTRLQLAYQLLKKDGSIFIHLDWNEVHYAKILMDEVFGRDCFRNEIIWCYTGPGFPKMQQLNRKHDNILWYSRNMDVWKFNGDNIRIKSEVHAGGFNGEMTTDVSNDYSDGGKIPEDWWQLFHTIDDIKEELERLNNEAKDNGMGDWLKYAVASRIRVDGEKRSGYLTEKPYKLMERLIKMASNENDIVLDFFAGSGTTGYVCSYLKRQFILVEQLDETQKILTSRFKSIPHVYCELAKLNQNFVD